MSPSLIDSDLELAEKSGMHILHLLSQTELTGAEVYAQVLIDHQVQQKHHVSVISDQMHVPLKVKWLSLPIATSSFFVRMKNIWKLRRFLKEQKIQVIHCHSRGAARHAHWARLGLPVAMITTLHGRQHFSWSKRLMNIYGDLQIAVCENIRLAMKRTFNMPTSPIRVLRNPITALQSHSENSTELKLALIGRSSGPKGESFEKIAQVLFEKWLQQNPNLKISIIASRPEAFSQSFQQNIHRLQNLFPSRIHLQGAVPDLQKTLVQFGLIIASGRIAAEGILAQTQVLAMGEYETVGLVTAKNLSESLQSNFGDIGPANEGLHLNLERIDADVQKWLQGARLTSSEKLDLFEKVKQEFDPQKISDQVLDIYRAALFKRHVPDWIPVLMYHKIPDQELNSQHRIFVTKENFRKHLFFFKTMNFQTVSFQDLKSFWLGEKDYRLFPKKPLLLTFDDGYKDNLKNAQPLLQEFQMKATLFVLGNHNIVENTWDSTTGEEPSALMTLEEKKSLDPKVWEIGSHGFDHLRLTEVSDKRALAELKNSKLQLEKDFNQPIASFAYPFGSTNEALSDLASQAGYQFAVNTDQGGLHPADNPRSLFRVNIFPEENWFSLWKKTSSWYRSYYFRKRGT